MNKSGEGIAHPNIAFIKYWGNRDDGLRLPANGSISMNLGTLYTHTYVEFRAELHADTLTISGKKISGGSGDRLCGNCQRK